MEESGNEDIPVSIQQTYMNSPRPPYMNVAPRAPSPPRGLQTRITRTPRGDARRDSPQASKQKGYANRKSLLRHRPSATTTRRATSPSSDEEELPTSPDSYRSGHANGGAAISIRHHSESIDIDTDLDFDPLMPDVVDDQVFNSVFLLSAQLQSKLSESLAEKILTKLLQPCTACSASPKYCLKDPTKLLFDDWFFTFDPSCDDGVAAEASASVSGESSGALPPISPRKPVANVVEVPVLASSLRRRLERPPDPLAFVLALEPFFRRRSPKSVKIEHVAFGSSPLAVAKLSFTLLSVAAPGSLKTLSMCFCSLKSPSLMMLMAGLQSTSNTAQRNLTDLDLSHNRLDQGSLLILSLFLPYSQVTRLSLRNNPIGSGLENFQQADLLQLIPNIASPPKTGRSSISTSRLSHQEVSGLKPPLTHWQRFLKECLPILESFDVSFTQLSHAEQTQLIETLTLCPSLTSVALDGLAINPTNAAKLAVAVGNASALANVSVNFNMNCASRHYKDKLRDVCQTRRKSFVSNADTSVATSTGASATATRIGKSPSSRSPRRADKVGGLLSSRNGGVRFLCESMISSDGLGATGYFLSSSSDAPVEGDEDMEGTYVPLTALTPGYAAYSTNDPSLLRRGTRQK